MRDTLSKFLIFAVGAGIGSVVTWKLIEAQYKKIVQEEIDSMDEYYRNKYGVEEPEKETEPEDGNMPDGQVNIREYAAQLAKNKYTNYSGNERPDQKEVDDVEKPYVIPPTEFGELDGYMTRTLYYHADGVLTDDQDEIVEDADDVVGTNFSDHYGEYEEDSVCVRNDAKRTDYEILYDPSNYYGDVNSNPHFAEVE